MSEELTPITRIEEYLDGIVNGGAIPLEPVTRVEQFLDAIANSQTCALTPVTRIEAYLGKISGQSLTLPDPVTRVEMYLAAIAGEDVIVPDAPVTRIEEYLDAWANGGSPEYDTVTGSYVSFVTTRSAPLKELVVNVDQVNGCTGAVVTVNCGNVLPTSACYDVGYNPTVGQVKTPTVVSRAWTDNGDGTFSMETLASWAAASFLSVKLPAGKYNAHIKGVTGSFRYSLNVYDANYTVLARYTDSNVSTGTKNTVVTLTEPGYIALGIYGYTSPITIQEPCVLIAESFTGYVPYDGSTYSIDWTDEAGSITSGTITVAESGDVTLTTGGTDYDLGELNISTLAGQNYLWADTGDVSVTYYYPGTTASPIVGVGTVNNMVI